MQSIRAEEGWFVLHLFYRVERRRWRQLEPDERLRHRDCFARVFENFGSSEHCQIYSYSILGHKADFAVMLVDPELHHLNEAENALLASFPDHALQAVHSYLSMSETSEYIAREDDYDRTLREKEGLTPDSPDYQKKMQNFRERMKIYIQGRLYPQIPEHKIMCFYPMNKARAETHNWYALDFDRRKQLMGGHAITGRKFAGKVQQLVTGSTGLDAWEWGVTLFADDPYYLKKIVYEMRFDEVSARYGQFGDFFVGIRLEPQELFDRLKL